MSASKNDGRYRREFKLEALRMLTESQMWLRLRFFIKTQYPPLYM
ncbi:MAG: hypothetical protein ACI9Y8_002016 [Candidatus Omnitrophota bacterium]|jgi:hypothetical protein